MRFFITILLLASLNSVFGQGEVEFIPITPNNSLTYDTNDVIYVVVEEMPQFPGGEEAMRLFIRINMQYPSTAKGIEGIVFVNFVVRSDGHVTDPKILRGIGSGCDEEALRLIRAMPTWLPGKQGGKKVSVSYNLPIKFKP